MTMTRSVYSQKLRDALEALRPAFRSVGQDLAQVTRKRAEIAPAFLKAFTIWRRETRRPFVAFVHELDPTVPTGRDGYRNHPSYQAALYIKSKAEQPADATTRRGATPLTLLAVTIKSFLPLCGSQREQQEALQAILAASKWRERDQRRLLAAIRRVRPVALPKAPRLVAASKMTKAAVVAFERTSLAS